MSTALPSGLWLRGDTYYARFRVGGREIREKLSTNKKTAVKMLHELRRRAELGDMGVVNNDYPWPKLKEEFLGWSRQKSRPDHFKNHERDLKKIDEYCSVQNVKQIDESYVREFRQWRLADGVSPRTVNAAVTTLKTVLNKGVRWRRIHSNPIKGMEDLPHDEPCKDRRPLDSEEIIALFDNTPPHLVPVWRMFATTGMRRGELIRLLFTDIDFDRATVTVTRRSKTHREREIPLDDVMLETLADLRRQAAHRQPVPHRTKEGRLSREHVFVTGANTPWYNGNNLLRAFYACCKKADIDGAHRGGDVDIQALRVTFTTLAMEGGASPKAVQALLGHATLEMTMSAYGKATDRAKRDAINVLPFASHRGAAHVLPLPRPASEAKCPDSEREEIAIKMAPSASTRETHVSAGMG
jgi:integrase